ncbi:MAG: beta-lactamase family protein [Gemmatimonadetes bacterium]|nr:beta-lactamase family protein [Gemmatimonadota bacterium]
MNTQRTIRPFLSLPLCLLLSPLFWAGFLSAQESPFPPASPESQGIGPEVIESLDRRVQSWVEAGRIVGAELLVIKNHRSVLHRAFGWKDREQGRAMEPNTIFNIRSMTKPLVAMATQMLIEEGALALEDRVADFLPAFRPGNAAKITVEHLLTHRSGLPVSLAFDPENPSQTLQELAAAIGAAGPEFEPGTRFWYSDAGADVLAALIEIVSGQSLEIFIQSRLFEPLGMTEAGFLTQLSGRDLPADRTAVLYGGTAGAWQRFWEPSEDPFYPFPLGSQSVYATPLDYARFLTLWVDGGSRLGATLLSEESVRRTLTPASPMTQIGSTSPYPTAFPGLEVWHGQMALLYRDADGAGGEATKAVGYAGSDGTFAWIWPREDLMVLFFTQSRGQNVHMALEATLHDLLLEPKAHVEAHASPHTGSPEAASPPIPDAFRPYLGLYRADFGPYQGAEFTVLVQGGALAVDIPGQMVFTLEEPDEEGWRSFTLTDLIAVSFQEGASGEVEALWLAQTSVFPKQSSPQGALEAVPDSIRPLLGDYELPAGQGVLSLTWEDGAFTVTDPAGRVTPLAETDAPGAWETDEHPPKRVSFTLDTEGNAVAIRWIEIVDLPRVGPGV